MISGKFRIKRTWSGYPKQTAFEEELYQFCENKLNFTVDTVIYTDIIVVFNTYNEKTFYEFIQLLLKYYLFDPKMDMADIIVYRLNTFSYEILGYASLKTLSTEGFHERFVIS